MKTAKIETLKNGEFIRRIGGKEVFTKQAYCRFNKKYQIDSENDISRAKYLKKGTLVEIDFEY